MSHVPNDDCKESEFRCDFENDDEGKCPCAQIGDAAKKVYEENRVCFDEWFGNILITQETCLQRDVLRDSKEQLWKAWQERKPYFYGR